MLTPMKAIRAKCLDRCGGQAKEVRMCLCENCPLYPYRMGHRPKGYTDTSEGADAAKNAGSPTFFEKARAL